VTEDADTVSQARAERIARMIENLLPRIRPLSGHLSEEELLEAASYMAVYRLADEEAADAALVTGTGPTAARHTATPITRSH
jgi:hypothetical protein